MSVRNDPEEDERWERAKEQTLDREVKSLRAAIARVEALMEERRHVEPPSGLITGKELRRALDGTP